MIGKFLLSPGTRRKPVANGLRVLLPLGVAALAAAGMFLAVWLSKGIASRRRRMWGPRAGYVAES